VEAYGQFQDGRHHHLENQKMPKYAQLSLDFNEFCYTDQEKHAEFKNHKMVSVTSFFIMADAVMLFITLHIIKCAVITVFIMLSLEKQQILTVKNGKAF
jgi:hypothetical protein